MRLEAIQAPVSRKSRTVVLENELDLNYSKLRSSFVLDLTPTSPQTNKKDYQLRPYNEQKLSMKTNEKKIPIKTITQRLLFKTNEKISHLRNTQKILPKKWLNKDNQLKWLKKHYKLKRMKKITDLNERTSFINLTIKKITDRNKPSKR
jgi:hypothetical protein